MASAAPREADAIDERLAALGLGGKRRRPRRPGSRAGAALLPSLDLGVKASFTTRQWLEQERDLHKRAVEGMTSPVRQEIIAHQGALERSRQILAKGQDNKAKSLEARLRQVKDENAELARRLRKVQLTETEITTTNKPGKQRHVRALQERKRYLQGARRAEQLRLDTENSLILKRLATARTTVKPRKVLKRDWRRHQRIRKNMCRLAVPPGEELAYVRRKAAHTRSTGTLQQPQARGCPEHQDQPAGKAKRGASRRKKKRAGKRLLPAVACAESKTRGAGTQGGLPGWIDGREKGDNADGEPWHADLVRPISRSRHTIDVPEVATGPSESVKRVLSSTDRGQICHEWVELAHIVPGELPQRTRALLMGFKKESEPPQLIFEVAACGLVRYAQVDFDDMRRALDRARVDAGRQVSLASAAAERLTLFGHGNDDALKLVWNATTADHAET